MELSHYEVLGVPRTVTAAEVKAAFHALALAAHPDKARDGGSSSVAADFVRLQRAWEVLRDAGARAEYDAQLACGAAGGGAGAPDAAASQHVSDEVELADMDELPSGELGDGVPVFSYACRCSGAYQMPVDEVQAAAGASSLVLPCTSCSLRIRVHLPGVL